MSDPNYYEILEVYPAAGQEEIEQAYRLLLYKYHPDHNPDRLQWAHEMTAKVVEAYQTLSNPEKKRLYNFQIYCPLKRKPAERRFFFFQKSKKKQWELALAQFTAGVALFAKQKPKAMAKFQEALRYWPDFSEPFFNIGLCLADARKLEEAKTFFNKVRAMQPKDQDILRTLRRLDDLSKPLK